MTPAAIRCEVDRLARLSAWPGCPGGWQYPFDFGYGIVAPTYNGAQATLHPWRRKVLLDNLDRLFAGHYHEISVLDLGSCEGAMAEGLWQRGVRDITCIEARPINVKKARFVALAKGYDFRIINAEISEYLASETRNYDLVLFAGVMNHLLDPFAVSHRIAACTRQLAVYETSLAQPSPVTFDSPQDCPTTKAAFFIRVQSRLSNTGGLRNLELWPTREALELTLREAGFADTQEIDYGPDPDLHFASGQRAMYFAFKRHERQGYGVVGREALSGASELDPFFANLLSPPASPVTVDLIGRDLSDILCDRTQPTDTKKHAAYYMAQVHEYRGEWTEMAAMLDFCGVTPGWDDDRYDLLEHAGWAHVFLQEQEKAIGRGIPPIQINSLWHSGSSFLAAFITTALEIDRCRTSKGREWLSRLVPRWLSTLLRGGATTHEHFSATPDNIAAMEAAGVRRLSVHVRHPVATMISMYRLFTATGWPDIANSDSPTDMGDMAAYAEIHLEYIVQFLETWRSYAARPNCGNQVVFTRFEDMVADPAEFGRALLARHLGTGHTIDAAAIMHQMNTEARRDGAYNFRGAHSKHLAAELDSETREVVDRIVTPELLQFYDYKI